MRGSPLFAVVVAAVSAGCGGSSSSSKSSTPSFDGGVGTAWETLAAGASDCPGFSDYTPAGKQGLFDLSGTTLSRFTPTGGWSALAGPPEGLACWPTPAWIGDSLYAIRNNAVFAYAIAGDSWTTPVASGVPNTADAQTTHDDLGRAYAVETDSPYRVIRFTPGTNDLTYLASGGFNGTVSEPRIAWDSATARLWIAPSYALPELWSFDPENPGTAAQKADVPAAGGGTGTGMGDPFCADRHGHLYAIGDSGCTGSASVFQYDIATDAWRAIPDLPEDHGCNGACTVSDDGWLYLATGDTTNLYRLKLN